MIIALIKKLPRYEFSIKKKLILAIFLILFLTFFTSYTSYTKTVGVKTVGTVAVTKTSIVEVKDEAKIAKPDKQLIDIQAEIEESGLNANLNDWLGNVYYVYGENAKNWVAGTGFSMEYHNKFYLIAAGHILDCEWGIFEILNFKANFSDKWISPELIAHSANLMAFMAKEDETLKDYAIFYSNEVKSGFPIDDEGDNPDFILGCEILGLNTIKDSNTPNIMGESGSPIIDKEGEIIGISVTNYPAYYTPISVVKSEIDKIEGGYSLQ